MHAQECLCRVKVRRSHVFEDSFAEIMQKIPEISKRRLLLAFDSESDDLDSTFDSSPQPLDSYSRVTYRINYILYWNISYPSAGALGSLSPVSTR